MLNRDHGKFLYIIPALCAFIIGILVTVRYQWPIGWDIYYHIHLARVYMLEGLTLHDPLYNAPSGNIINYPPIFHLTLILVSYILQTGLFEAARFMQPVLISAIVLSVTIVASRFYEDRYTGLAAGILFISGSVAVRSVSPIPENMALIILPFSIYMYYEFFREERDRLVSALLSGALMGTVALIHPAATVCLVFSVTLITAAVAVANIVSGSVCALKRTATGYLAFLIVGIIIASIWWLPALYVKSTGGAGGVSTGLQFSRGMSILHYPGAFGYLTALLSIPGLVAAVRKRGLRDLFIVSWILSMLILSKGYYIGINVISYRVLIYMMIPLSILGAAGLRYCSGIIERKSRVAAGIFFVSVLFVALFQGYAHITSPKTADYGAMTPYGRIQIAPPSESEYELAEWFREQGGVAAFSNYYTMGFVAAYSDQKVNPILFTDPDALKPSKLHEKRIKYLVFDRRLKADGNFTFRARDNFLFYGSKTRVDRLEYPYLRKVYENGDFVVYLVTA
ncbi:hypothetical protein FZP57_04885 [Methanothermobacter sp. THM-1]|uniref:hypothetical protein n=1 Tax=Methanothermobacter sp. THM-1 TaxID=2606911 RepID=UPI0013673592|nr:hypothetical protein [Methanothermobacter sp. THM-1]QHN06454.1 hypothetical protein FZP57_04885 [Methanothermobacter sp. THM-1]